ncbi:hypothetical protein quinque_000830 [Culex quinquefasciatus]
MSDPRLRQLTIKTGVVKRLSKEKTVYEKEVDTQRNRIDKLKAAGSDDHVLRKQQEVLQECMMMVPDCQRSEKLTQLSDPALTDHLQRRLCARQKKRSWQKRRNARLKDLKAAQQANRDQLHDRIDQWQREQHKLHEEEQLVQHQLELASHFLADVHRRKATCKRYLAKFEKVRESRRRHHQDEGDDDANADLTELTKKWTAKLTECVREEKKMKDVLARRSAVNYQRRVENEWNRALFGDVVPKKVEDRDVLVRTRWEWDACLVGKGDDGDDASAVPLGWVLPPEDPTPEWVQYQMKEVGGV